MRCEYLLVEDKCEFMVNFSSSSAKEPGDEPVSELEVSDWEVRRARVGEGDDNFRSSLLTLLLVSSLVEPGDGNDFLRFFEFLLIINFKLLLDERLLLEEVQLNGEQVIFKSVGSSGADDVCRGLLDAEADMWRKGGTVSFDELRSNPSLEVATIEYTYQPNITGDLSLLVIVFIFWSVFNLKKDLKIKKLQIYFNLFCFCQVEQYFRQKMVTNWRGPFQIMFSHVKAQLPLWYFAHATLWSTLTFFNDFSFTLLCHDMVIIITPI